MKPMMKMTMLGLLAVGASACGKASAQTMTQSSGVTQGGVVWKDAAGKLVPVWSDAGNVTNLEGTEAMAFFDASGLVWRLYRVDGTMDVAWSSAADPLFSDSGCGQLKYLLFQNVGRLVPPARFTFRSKSTSSPVYVVGDKAAWHTQLPAGLFWNFNGSCRPYSAQSGSDAALSAEDATPASAVSPPSFDFTLPLHPEFVQ